MPPRPVPHRREPWTAARLAAELIWRDRADQPYEIVRERRLAALEEALVSRRARRRLRRELSHGARRFAWAGPSFYARRIEAIGNEILCWRDPR
ncbi:MAG TPA: hypothetical protein VMA73_34555 [Streptosporangiaceae bacterium]|nr:hypothetical protein [Streptosporangiaceae bacterium]